MKKFVLAICALFALSLLPFSAWAVECLGDIKAAESNIKFAEEELENIPERKRARVNRFLEDGRKLVEKAKLKCTAESPEMEKLESKAISLVAQGNISAAVLLIKEGKANWF